MLRIFSLYLFAANLWADLSPDEILKKTDDIRNPMASFHMIVTVESDEGSPSKFDVLTKGRDRTLIKTLEPARDRKRKMLIKNDDMWVFMPALDRALRVSLSDRLTGQAANGDIARMRWSADYSAKIEKIENNQWVLFLEALRKGVTYGKIRVWVNQKDFFPIKAEYLALSGQPLKNAEFGVYKKLAGEMRPTEIKITDANRKNRFSVIRILELEPANPSDGQFQESSLK